MCNSDTHAVARVLVAEDDESHAFLITQALSICNVSCECAVASNGIEALEQLRSSYEQGQPFDLVLMDLNMPQMNGREALLQIKQDERLRHIPVVMLTTSNNTKDVGACYDDGAASYIIKPVGLDELLVAMELTITFWCKLALRPGRREYHVA